MKRISKFLIPPLFCLLFAFSVGAQTTAWQSIIGEVTAIDQTAGRAAVSTADKKEIAFEIDKKAVFLRVKPNEKSLENAAKISPSEIVKGVKILARGFYTSGGVFNAQMIIVVSNAEVADQNENVEGVVTAIDATKKHIRAAVNSPTGVRELTLDVSAPQTRLYRYSDKSLKFDNALPSSFDKVKPGDQLKAVGKTDGVAFLPQTIVFGTFRTVGGKVVAVNAEKRELSIEDFQSRKVVKVSASQEILSRFIDSQRAEELIDKYFKAEAVGQRKDLRAFFDRLPLIPFEQVAAGDQLIVSVIVDEDAAMTAFYLLKDVKPIFAYLEKLQKKGQPLPNLGGLNL